MKPNFSPADSTRLELNSLLEIAHLAFDEQMFEEAQEMFALLTRLRPSNPHPRIGQALVMYGQHRLDDAIALLEGVLRDFPQAVFTRSLLARFLLEADSPGWQRHAQEVLLLVSEGVAFELAQTLLRSNAFEQRSESFCVKELHA